MLLFKNIFFNLFCFTICILQTANIIAQPCSGSWATQRPLTVGCVSGQWIGEVNSTEPGGCPITPIYVTGQTNTFTFNDPVSDFAMDFTGFTTAGGCGRMEIKINGTFFPLTSANLIAIPLPGCTGSFSFVTVTPDGYITSIPSSQTNSHGHGRILLNGIIATNITVSTNDPLGIVVSSPFNCTTVPLKLESFTGQNNDCKALLNWKTGIEFNVKNIEIERSEDGNIFNKVGEASPKGSDSWYSFIAVNTSSGFFRLRINDLDGYFEYSEIIHIKSSCNKDYYSISPNPTSGEIKISGLKNSDQLLILDMLGKIVMQFDVPANNKLNIQSLPPGIYVLQVFNADGRKAVLKLIRN